MAEKAIDGMLAKNAADLAKEQEVSRRCFAFSARGVNHQVMRIMKAFKLKYVAPSCCHSFPDPALTSPALMIFSTFLFQRPMRTSKGSTVRNH